MTAQIHTDVSTNSCVVTLTTNPTLDAISEVVRGKFLDKLARGEVTRVQPFRYQVGGKGVTCGRMLKVLGGKCLAVVLLGKDGVSRCVEHYLRCEGIKAKILRTNALGRICLILTEVEGDSEAGLAERATTGVDYRVNGRGSPIAPEVIAKLLDALRGSLRGAAALALAGSLPESAPANFYAQCITLARKLVPLVMLDSSAEPLLHGAMARPHLIKINAQEAAGLMAESVPGSIQEAAGLAWRIVSRFNQGGDGKKIIEKLVITMGAAGAAAIDVMARLQWVIKPPRVRAQGALGAGDSFSAGLAHALTRGKDFTEALRWGTACGAATAKKRAGEVGDLESVLQFYKEAEVVPLELHAEAAIAAMATL